MEVGLGQRLVKDLVVSLVHRQMDGLMMSGLRMGRSGEIGWVSDLMVVDVYRRDEFWEIGLGFGEVIDGCRDVGSLG